MKMAAAKISLLGMYQWTDGHLFDDISVPEGIDKDLFINNLLLEKGELEVLYGDSNFFKLSINVWGAKWYHTFEEWLRGISAEYSPIENYDRYEDTGITHRNFFSSKTKVKYDEDRTLDTADGRTADLTDTLSPASTETTTYNSVKDEQSFANYKETETYNNVKETTSYTNLKDTTSYTNLTDTHSQTVDGTSTHEVSAFDSSSLVPSSKDTTNTGTSTDTRTGSQDVTRTGSSDIDKTGNQTHEIGGTTANTRTGNQTVAMSGSDTTTHTGTDTTTHTGTDKLHTEGTTNDTHGGNNGRDTTTSHIHGNIGVTTNAQLLEGFYKISAWNIYTHMADTFATELLVNVY